MAPTQLTLGPVGMKRPEHWQKLTPSQILAGMSAEQLNEGERRALNGIALIEAERAIEPQHDTPKMYATRGGAFEAAMEADLDYRMHLYRSALFDVRAEIARRAKRSEGGL